MRRDCLSLFSFFADLFALNSNHLTYQADLSPDSDVEQEYGEVAEEVVVTSEEPIAGGSSSNATSLPDHDYNIYRVNKKNKVAAASASEATTDVQDEQMEAVAQSVAAAAQEKEKLKRKRGAQSVDVNHDNNCQRFCS